MVSLLKDKIEQGWVNSCALMNYPFGIFLLLVIVLSILRCKVSDYPFVIFLLLVIVLFVL